MNISVDLQQMDLETQKNITSWLNGKYDDETKESIQKLLKDQPQEAVDAFYKTLSFGTGGMRGIMGVGTNRMNLYTIQTATQGLANYLLTQISENERHSVFIGFDSRHHSQEFAETAAKVLAGNNIHVYLCQDLRPTPLVSFGCRFKKCTAAIMITASHNPPEYNGYKVYWADGGQVLPPHDIGIVDEVNKITDLSQIHLLENLDSPLIEMVEEEIDDAYLEAISTLQLYPQQNKSKGAELKVIYTSLHGTGITLAPRALSMWGFTNLSFVDQQIIPNGDFPTAHYPNPEEKAALSEGIKVLQEKKADLLIATDPDADRVGIVVQHQGESVILTGNQVACIVLQHICEALKDQGKIDDKTAFVKTIVTTELFRKIAEHFGGTCFDVLTGFKYIAEKIRAWELADTYNYIFGGEESYGYLMGTFARDKDAILSSALICQIALKAKLENKTCVDLLHEIYQTYGIYWNKLRSINFEESKEGQEEMKQSMVFLRQKKVHELQGTQVVRIDDYLSSESHLLADNSIEKLALPTSDVLVFWLDTGSKVMVRPSGTEPKVKLYCEVLNSSFSSIKEGEKEAEEQAVQLLNAIEKLLKPSP
ncbi:Phosphoglucomutase [Chlamydiales bacterium STE3]|nr:Phosphoglucomutase [Chlamydiales bacterium STE3]